MKKTARQIDEIIITSMVEARIKKFADLKSEATTKRDSLMFSAAAMAMHDLLLSIKTYYKI